MAAKRRGKKRGAALRAWLGDADTPEEAAAEDEKGAQEKAEAEDAAKAAAPGDTGDADGSGDAPAGDATGGAQPAEEEPAAEAEAEQPEAKQPEAKADAADVPEGEEKPEKDEAKPDQKERLSTAWANVKRERKRVRAEQEQITRYAQQAEAVRAEAEKAKAEAQAILEAAKRDPLAFVQQQGVAARALLEAAAREEEAPAPPPSALEEKLDAALAKLEKLEQERRQQQEQHNERQELAELAHFLENPPDTVDVGAIQWWGTEDAAQDIYRLWVQGGRKDDLQKLIRDANDFFAERLARARPSTSESQAAPSKAPPERGNGAGQSAEPAARNSPPALSNAKTRRPTGGAKRTRAERKAAAIALLDTR